MSTRNKIYFASDVHLGVPSHQASLERERLFVQWLEEVRHDAEAIYIMGDLFDFWFEYKTVVPKGYVRVLGKLAEIRESGIPITFFVGNHDLWMFGYFEKELDIPVYHDPITIELKGKQFLIGHGDGIGPGDHGFKFIKKVFRNRICQLCFEWIHPNVGIGLADFWSRRSRKVNAPTAAKFKGEDQEYQIVYAKEVLEKEHFDYIVFGHRHLPMVLPLKNGCQFVNLGDWLEHKTYVVFDGETLELKEYRHVDTPVAAG